MKGHIGKSGDRWYVGWYDKEVRRTRKIYYHNKVPLVTKELAIKLRSIMQGDVENGTFRIEKYTNNVYDIIPYMEKWLKLTKPNISPSTYNIRRGAIKNWFKPFFESRSISLHEIQYDTLLELMNSITLEPSTKFIIMTVLHSCLRFAKRSGRIVSIPEFPRTSEYGIVHKPIRWLSTERQMAIINAIPEEDKPIFMWLKLHLRRPAEAMALRKEDFDGNTFVVRRSISHRKEVERTKTRYTTLVPCVREFMVYAGIEQRKQKELGILSGFYFVCRSSHKTGYRYTHKTMTRIWKEACAKVGEDINMYNGLKHSSCSQFINEEGYSLSQLQMMGDWRGQQSVRQYADVQLETRRALLEKKVISIGREKRITGEKE